jgi:hypothetical protein
MRPNVYLGMPFFDFSVHLYTSQCFWLSATNGKDVQLLMQKGSCSSALPDAFNGVLCGALDLRDKGADLPDGSKVYATHLAMIHADVAAQPYWLDILWSEMERLNADAISVAIPIKEDTHTVTSTAVGKIDDPWNKDVRHIKLADRGSLPETFGPEDVCMPGELLLINTGCMLLDLRKPYWDDRGDGQPFGFELISRVTKNKDGEREYFTRPEDWEMSRMLHRNKASYYATWKVKCQHFGTGVWRNF